MTGEHHLQGAVKRARDLRRRMTLPEKLLWTELRKLDLNIRRQAPVGRYIADFACHAACVIIEVDSARHDLSTDQLYDLERTAWLQSQGYRVLRYRNEHAADDNGSLETPAANSPPESLQATPTPPVHGTAG